MSLKNIIITTVIGILLIGGITAFALKNQPTSSTSNTTQSKSSTDLAMMKKEEAEKMAMEKAKASSSTSGEAMMKKEEESMVKTGYLDYSEETLSANKSGKNILFFKASWCPTCKSVDSDINANLSKIPSGTNILKIDYDSGIELKKKYGVTVQHTFVVVDNNGNKISSNIGAPSLDKILDLVK